MSAPRVRRSLDVVYYEWKNPQKPGDGDDFERLIKSMRAIQQRDPNDKWSFFTIGGYHGQPFRGKGETDGDYWGGYCNHGNVLFPTWHRAYLFDLENAMRSVEGCENVTLPFWDECANISNDPTLPVLPPFIPECLTLPKIQLKEDPEPKPNPIYSYRLQKAITDQIQGANQRYSKPEGYETVRYPLSGLVGNETDKEATQIYNANFNDPNDRREILNGNVGSWLVTGVTIPPDDNQPKPTPGPSDTTSVHARYLKCLNAPDYTVFSNTSSQAEWNGNNMEDQVMSLESPHNSIHLAVGGFYQKGIYNANPGVEERGANGDMGANEMAGFDPIFFFHHCFIDYVFWQWQKRRGLTQRGTLTVDYSIKNGTTIQEGAAGYPLGDTEVGQPITMNATKLHPFTGSNGEVLTSDDVTDIVEVGYTYDIGSLDAQLERGPGKPSWIPLIGEPNREIALKKRVSRINRADYPGSFVIRTFSMLPSGEEVEVERDAILSRWNVTNCRNCRDKLEVTSVVAIDKILLNRLQGGDPEKKPDFRVDIQLVGRVLRKPYPLERGRPWAPGNLVGGTGPAPPEPIIEDLF